MACQGLRTRAGSGATGGGDDTRGAPDGGDVSSRRLLGAHLPAAYPERRETVAGECLDCLAQFAIDVRLPLPATFGTAGPTCSLARTSVGRSTRCGSGGWNDDVALHRGSHQLIELAERRRGRGPGRCAARRARCRAAGVVERKV